VGIIGHDRCLAVTSMPSPDGWRISSLGQPQAKGGYIDCFRSSMLISASAIAVPSASDNHTGDWVSELAVRGERGLVTEMMRTSRLVKSAGLVVYSGRPSAIAVAAIIRSTARPRNYGLRR
jgi:hypothetical protein